MNTNTVNPEAPTTATDTGQSDSRPEQRYGFDPGRTGLRRPFQDRMLAGVSAGLARYFDVDVTIVRIVFAVLAVVGGIGVPLYLAGWLLIPDEDAEQSIASSFIQSLQARSR